jgi:hypothetical protein
VVHNDKDPNWVYCFRVVFIFQLVQPVRFCVYDADGDRMTLKDHDFVGYVDTTMQAIAASEWRPLELAMTHDSRKGARGSLVIKCEQAKRPWSARGGDWMPRFKEKSCLAEFEFAICDDRACG